MKMLREKRRIKSKALKSRKFKRSMRAS
jgi:hypothetical protein